jgi:hypothetical protein
MRNHETNQVEGVGDKNIGKQSLKNEEDKAFAFASNIIDKILRGVF